ncbi:MAG: hypothetical protein M3345_01520 [Actinomycetota bacterium]|nr:hypothetical protein [Actinomycetota bacterium]
MKKIAATICAVMVIGTTTQASATVREVQVSSQDGCGDSTEPTRTFGVKLRVLDDEYRIGEKARFRVRVHRILGGQDMGPVEGARVGVGVSLGDRYLWESGVTDPHGRASIEVALRRHTPAGWADVAASAARLIAIDAPCHSQLEYEYGDVRERELFRVVP